MFDNASFFIRSKTGALTGATWGSLGSCFLSGQQIGGDCEAIPTNVVRYDSPVFAGFSMSADWGQNGGYWDAYARYAGEWNGIKVAATSGWSQDNTADVLSRSVPAPAVDGAGQSIGPAGQSNWWQLQCWLLAVRPLHRARSNRPVRLRCLWPGVPEISLAGFNSEPEHWMVKGGLRERWSSLGHTVLYGSYDQRNDMFNAAVMDLSGNLAVGFTQLSITGTPRPGSGALVWCRKSMQLPCRCGCSMTTSMPRASGCTSVGGLNPAALALLVSLPRVKAAVLTRMQLVKFGGLINF